MAIVTAASVGFGWRQPSAQSAQQGEFTEAILASDALRTDLSLLRTALEQAHPGLLRYATQEEVNDAFAAANDASRAPLRERQFLKQVARILGVVRDDHTYALPSSSFWREAIGPTRYGQRSTAGTLPLFPFFVTAVDDRLFVTHSNGAVELPRGTELLMINGTGAADVLAELRPLMPTSGFTKTFRTRHFEQFSPHQEYNGFVVNYALFIATPERFGLEIRTPAGAVSAVTVPAVRAPELWATFRTRYVGTGDSMLKRDHPFVLTFPSPRTAALTASAFHAWRWNQAKLSYERDIATTFARINASGAETLVLDLRGNEGGTMNIAVEILRHVTREPFQVYHYKEMTGYRFPGLTPYLANPKDLDHLTADLFETQVDGRLRIKTTLPDETWSRPLAPAPGRFVGRLIVLVDGATGSAAAQLATLIRVNRSDAIFVGEESGGDMEGPISGSYLSMTLPHSKLRVEVPVLKKVLHLNRFRYQRGRGVIPDHVITPTQEDIAHDRDPVLAFALQGK